MLLELHVRNLALIEKADLEFDKGFSVLTGETGAGKSILIDSIHIATGAKFSKDMIRTGANDAFVEVVFQITDAKLLQQLKEWDVEPEEDGIVIIQRKVNAQRSTIKLNDESITISKLRQISAMLLDIHGQNEHHFLMNQAKQLKVLDSFGIARLREKKMEVATWYREYKALSDSVKEELDERIRDREIEILNYEIEEIIDADILPNEEEELLAEFRKLKNFAKICQNLSQSIGYLREAQVSMAVRLLKEAQNYDRSLENLTLQVEEVDALLYDVVHALDDYLGDTEFDEERFAWLEDRLEVIHRISQKYGDYDAIQMHLKQKRERLEFLQNYEQSRNAVKEHIAKVKEKLTKASEDLSEERKEIALRLKQEIIEELSQLNFLNLEFDISFTKQSFSADGTDGIAFEISTNPGEPLKPLKDVLSGGELSRAMLAIKTVLSKVDDIETLIFDEVDAGISGRTAQMVSEKLSAIGCNKQVLCISHLPQIAAMADHHYRISKSSDGKSTKTEIVRLDESGMIEELARLLGGTEITSAVRSTAEEMKLLADSKKHGKL